MLITKLKLIGYVRSGHTDLSCEEQIDALKNYCIDHGYKLVSVYRDNDELGAGYNDMMDAMSNVDGIITYDVTRLVSHPSDTLRELRPLFKNRFMRTGKKILTVAEGIENLTAAGQAHIIEFMNDWSRREELQALPPGAMVTESPTS